MTKPKRSITIYGIAVIFLAAIIYGMFAPKKYPSLWWKYIKENNIGKMSVLLTSKKINLEEKIAGYTPLLFACSRNNFKIAKMLVAAGSDVNVTNDLISPLSRGALAGEAEFVKLLLQKGAKPNLTITTGGSPLDYSKNIIITKILVEHGADINFKNPVDGFTPLMSAISKDDNLSAKYLIAHGADITNINSLGETALSIARKNKNKEMENILLDIMNKKSSTKDSVH